MGKAESPNSGREPVDQGAAEAYEHAIATAAPLLSGEMAADLSTIGMVRTPDPVTATLELVAPEDPTVRPQANRLPTEATLSGRRVELA